MHDLKNLDPQVTSQDAISNSYKNILRYRKRFKNICDLFEAQSHLSPTTAAVIFKHKKLSYFDLNKKSDELASYLRRQGVKPGVVVGLSLSKNENLIISILGILKSGGTYLPLDMDYPRERLKYMIEDARPSFIVTEPDLANRLPANSMYKILSLDMVWKD